VWFHEFIVARRKASLEKRQVKTCDTLMHELERAADGIYLREKLPQENKKIAARLRSEAEALIKRLDQNVVADPKQSGILDRSLDGWRGLSEKNNLDLAAAADCARELLAKNGWDAATIPVGLGFVGAFNAWHHRTIWGSIALIDVPLVVCLDALNTISLALGDVLQRDPIDSHLLNSIIKSFVAGGDFMGGRSNWFSSASAALLDVSLALDGPNLNWSRTGYFIAMTQRCWIILHEFGHAILYHRHTRGGSAKAQEFEADEFATTILDSADDEIRRRFTLKAPDVAIPLLFEYLELADGPKPEHYDTHPLASERRERQRILRPEWGFEASLTPLVYGTKRQKASRG
jgi:hypothetical protein